jgi:hypothetical protein
VKVSATKTCPSRLTATPPKLTPSPENPVRGPAILLMGAASPDASRGKTSTARSEGEPPGGGSVAT